MVDFGLENRAVEIARTHHANGLLGRERPLNLKALEEKLGFKIFPPE